MPREGTLLPETYKFPRGTTREQVIQRMQQAQKRVLAEIWERRNPDIPVKSPEQLVTLASIVEKETGRADERSRVAAVFVNRLRQKIKLQSDPTIIYGLVGGKGTLGRPIKRSEITQPSPYNTYVIEGLPPGPIANPGRASLEAAANPARTRDLFFVADGTGGHTFTETYDAAPEERRQAARDGKADPERHGRAGRRCAAAGRCRRAGRRPTPIRPPRTKPPAAKKRHGRRAARRAPAQAPARQGAAQSTTAAGGAALAARSATQDRSEFHFAAKSSYGRARSLRVSSPAFGEVSRDGAVEHDRLCPQPRRQRALYVRMGIEVGQRQGL